MTNKHNGYLRRDSNPEEVRTIRPRPVTKANFYTECGEAAGCTETCCLNLGVHNINLTTVKA